MDALQESSLLATPLSPPEKTPWWSHKKVTDPRAGPILDQTASLAEARLTRAMIIKEFLGHHITPLHAQSRPLWGFTVGGDPICLHVNGWTPHEMDGVLGALLGHCPEDLPQVTPPLYAYDDMEEMVTEILIFNE
ncbi:hypothetical protein D1007_20714 [Hordeum vulgare]|nr:hypothetical protein D1007_20714 [Hordeum vulgare]